MGFTADTAAEAAKRDLSERIGQDQIAVEKITERDFPNMSLGSPEDGEMSAQMISSGWEIILSAAGETYEYRADKYQLRLHNYKGKNHVIQR